MKKSYKAFFTIFVFVFLISTLPLNAATRGPTIHTVEKWKEEVLKYLSEVLLTKPKNTTASFINATREGNEVMYKYFLVGSWGAGSAALYAINGKGVLIKYDLTASLQDLFSVCLSFIKNSFGMRGNLTLGKYQKVVAEVFPGTNVFRDAIEVPVYSYWNSKIPKTNLTETHTIEIGKASILFIDKSPVFCGICLSPYVLFPPVWIENSTLVKTCQKIFRAFIGQLPPGNETITYFEENKDVLGEMGGTVRIVTQGSSKSRLPGSVSIAMNSWGQITFGAMGKCYAVNATYIKRCGGVGKLAKEILGRDYMKFLGILANFSGNPQFKSFISEIMETGYGSYLGVEYSSFIIKMEGTWQRSVEYRYYIQKVNKNTSGTLGEHSFAQLDIIKGKKGKYEIFESGSIRILKTPKINLNKAPLKVSSEKVRSEISALLRGNYSVEGISMHYVSRINKEVPEYMVNCTSSVCHLTLKVSGLDGKILDISYSFREGQSPLGIPKVSHKEGILIIEIGITIAVIIGIAAWAITWRRKKKLGL